VGEWGSGTNRSIDQWRTSSGGDKHTWSTTSGSLSASNLFTSIGTGNLNIQTGNSVAWIVSGKGIAVSGQSTDYNGNSRVTTISGGCTEIGSHEFSATPPSNPLATQVGTPGSGVTTSYTLWGRTLCSIEWGTGGTLYPLMINTRYYSGVVPNNIVGGNYSNSYWQVEIGSGTLSGATYNITFNFGDNETYSITPASSDTRLAKKISTSWEVFLTAGTGAWQTELNWANLWLKTRGLADFSEFTLTDANSPLPVVLEYFDASAFTRNVVLKWRTSIEINNKGFYIERKYKPFNTANYSGWETISFVNGNGNTDEPKNYSYDDTKLISGNYMYRLKQVDFNGNYEYFMLNNPDEITIGIPASFDVSQNYPNPSNPVSKIDYQIPFSSKVVLKIYDITGREVAVVVNKHLEAGYYTSEFDGSNLSSGVYIYRLSAESQEQKFSRTMKMILIK
jgi:hypothetical protein